MVQSLEKPRHWGSPECLGKREVSLSQCWVFLVIQPSGQAYCCMAAPCDPLSISLILKYFYLKSFFLIVTGFNSISVLNGSVLVASLKKRSSLGSALTLPFSSGLSTFSRLLFAVSSRTGIVNINIFAVSGRDTRLSRCSLDMVCSSVLRVLCCVHMWIAQRYSCHSWLIVEKPRDKDTDFVAMLSVFP